MLAAPLEDAGCRCPQAFPECALRCRGGRGRGRGAWEHVALICSTFVRTWFRERSLGPYLRGPGPGPGALGMLSAGIGCAQGTSLKVEIRAPMHSSDPTSHGCMVPRLQAGKAAVDTGLNTCHRRNAVHPQLSTHESRQASQPRRIAHPACSLCDLSPNDRPSV
ncbi:uncharacterized protein B0I36DRAFT_44235 [Microdochium trichocladiopsis]|uniref:Uncharacterized protein n=1 Tax=Microdochium trichocladiopsis TaxID=1682393 RepID=A0A9P9BJ02_9PEZI|nr:uncharacterized protein B0I36DRAFT_44235 [Microdochium trichocladiopsis]KAH7016271.1 hypothetical protein B0I36DRAFT_44235 [Microdochium trichocladiopsis]